MNIKKDLYHSIAIKQKLDADRLAVISFEQHNNTTSDIVIKLV